MKIEEQTTVTYKTSDGRVFNTKKEAEEHVEALGEVEYFTVFAYPDLTEGRHGPKKAGIMAVCAKNNHEMFAAHAMFEKFGSSVAFVQGVFGANAITEKWRVVKTWDVDGEIICTVQAKFTKHKVFDDGINWKL